MSREGRDSIGGTAEEGRQQREEGERTGDGWKTHHNHSRPGSLVGLVHRRQALVGRRQRDRAGLLTARAARAFATRGLIITTTRPLSKCWHSASLFDRNTCQRGAPGQREGTADSPSQETHAQRPNVHTHMRARTHAVHTRHHIDTHTTPTTSHTLLFTGPTHRRSDDELDDGRFRVVLVIAHLERVGGDALRDLSRSKPHQRKKRGQFAGPHKDANQSGGGMRQNTCSSSCPWRPPTACLRSALCFRLASSAPSATVGSRAGALAGAASRRTIMSQSAVLVSSWDRPIRAQSAVTLSPCVC